MIWERLSKTITRVSVYCNWLELDIDFAGAQVHGMAIASCPKGLGIWKPPRHCSRSRSSCRARPASWPTSRCCGRLGMWCASSERRTVASASRPFFVSSTRQTAKPPNPPNRHQTCGAVCHSGVPQLLLLLDFVRDHVGHWCETSNMSETFSVGQQLTFPGFLAIVWRCLQSTKYKMDKWDHVNSCDHMIHSIRASRGKQGPQ